MRDRELRALERRARTDDDPGRLVAEVLGRARVEGAAALLAPLLDRVAWHAAPEQLQDLAIEEVRQRLGSAFDHTSTQVYECWNKPRCATCGGRGEVPSWGAFNEDDADFCPDCYVKDEPAGSKLFSHRLATFRHCASGLELNLVPGAARDWDHDSGVCSMCDGHRLIEGNPCGECNGSGHATTLIPELEPFLIGRWPVTRLQWNCWAAGDRLMASPRTATPRAEVNEWLTEQGLRLPLADEWIYACRAGTVTRYYWGEALPRDHCWHHSNSADRLLDEPPGTRMARHHNEQVMRRGHHLPHAHPPAEHDDASAWNSFGLVDMLGNVWESLGDDDAIGCCYSDAPGTVAVWESARRDGQGDHIGFRVALSIPGGAG